MRNTKTLPEYREYLKGKYYGILRDYEKGWDYEKLLDSLLIELTGAFQDFDSQLLNSLYSKTCALKYLKYNMLLYQLVEFLLLLRKN